MEGQVNRTLEVRDQKLRYWLRISELYRAEPNKFISSSSSSSNNSSSENEDFIICHDKLLLGCYKKKVHI